MRISSSKKYGNKQYVVFNNAKGFKGNNLGFIHDYCRNYFCELLAGEMSKVAKQIPPLYRSTKTVSKIELFKSITDEGYLLCAFSDRIGEQSVRMFESIQKLHEFLLKCYNFDKAYLKSLNLEMADWLAALANSWLEAIANGIGGDYSEPYLYPALYW